jgi:integrase
MEAELDRGGLPVDSRALRSHTLADLLKRYTAEVMPRKRIADRELYMLRVILVILRNTKNGFPRTVPLTTRAINVIKDTPRRGPTVFAISANALRLAWERLRRKAGVLELRFHDLRHEAVSRFFERGLNVAEVAMISGHRDLRMLFRYTHPKPENVAAKLSTSC